MGYCKRHLLATAIWWFHVFWMKYKQSMSFKGWSYCSVSQILLRLYLSLHPEVRPMGFCHPCIKQNITYYSETIDLYLEEKSMLFDLWHEKLPIWYTAKVFMNAQNSPVSFQMVPDLDWCFKESIHIKGLQLGPVTSEYLIFNHVEEEIKLNLFNHHLSLITDFQSYMPRNICINVWPQRPKELYRCYNRLVGSFYIPPCSFQKDAS